MKSFIKYTERAAAQIRKSSYVQYQSRTWVVSGREGSLIVLRRGRRVEHVKGSTRLNVLR